MKNSIIIAFVLIGIIGQAQVRNYPPSGSKSKVVNPSSYSNNSSASNSSSATKTEKVKKVKPARNNNFNDDWSGPKFGLMVGYQLSTELGDKIIVTNYRKSFSFGASMKGNFSEKLGVKLDLIYSKMGAYFGSELDDLTYIQFPILLNYNVYKSINVNVGPKINLLTSATFYGEDYIDELNAFEYGIAGGVDFQIPKTKIIIGGRYYYGLSNIVDDDSLDITNSSYSVNLYYYF